MRTARAVPTPWLCRKTMISRTTFCSAQAAVMRPARTGPMPSTSRRRSGSASMTSNTLSKAAIARFHALDGNHAGTLDRWKLGATVTAWQFRRADADKDRTLDMNEYLAMVETLFRAADKDHDGTLDRKELNSWAGRFLLRLFGPKQGPIF